MKALSIIGIVLFGFLFLGSFGLLMDVGEPLEEFESLQHLVGYIDYEVEDAIQDFTDDVWGLAGAALLSSGYGFIFSVVACIMSFTRHK